MIFKSFSLLVLSMQCAWTSSFAPKIASNHRASFTESKSSTSTALDASNYLEPGDPVLLVGPSFLQLVLARHLKKAGLKPIIVAQQKKLDSFFQNLVLDEELQKDSTIGMPETGDPYFGELKGVVFCAEDAILPSEFITRVLDFTHEGKSAFDGGAPTRAICLLPVEGKVQKEKSASWIPIFNNDRTIDMNWKNFREKFENHAVYKSEGGVGSIMRFGSLFGGSSDGPPFLKEYALEEGMYKMSLEQYRDLRERSFDRYKLSGQVLEGNSINPKPPNQEKMEKEALTKFPGEVREAFSILGGYPEIDRANRHTLASAVAQALMKPAEDLPKEMTILSKATSELNTPEEWDNMFQNPKVASWPDPYLFKPEEFGIEVEKK